ncbi:MAG: ABC transporter ATP-binding protein [Actinomycetota bacterium]|nr:ABC transporter ATP-binding protein [Actinomycetota bacterium]
MSLAVEVRGVRKRYGGLAAVEDLTFAIQSGEILGVLGPNGAGKTTAIRVLTTILAPTRGTFEVAGVSHTQPAKIRQRIGVLPESAGYPDRQTGEEYLRYHARLYGHRTDSARATADSLLSEVGLHDRGRSLIDTYSRGMKQRLGIARALVNSPEVVFLDEPTLGLDPAGQRQMLALVRLIAEQRGATVLLSTHLLAEVEETCTRVLILNRGRVAAEGTVAEVSRRAAAPRSARLRVPAELLVDALQVLSHADGIQAAEQTDGQPGTLRLTLREEQHGVPTSAALSDLTNRGVPVLAFELEGARLSDAFLAMTEGAGDE